MKIIRYPDRDEWPGLLRRPVMDSRSVDTVVVPVLEEVRKNGDRALAAFTKKFDHVDIDTFEVSAEEISEADNLVEQELKTAIEKARENIEVFHRMQHITPARVNTTMGVVCWQKAVAIEKVGLYIPGGTAPLFSTVLMLAIPATIAGCSEIILCTPPNKAGKVHPAVLYAAKISGITRVYKVGGAQAIAAMAYGTETIPRVYKIFGPGNQYVTAAKQLVSRSDVAIDMPAGPSELAVVADESANPAFVASDLLSQAEHGADSQVLLFTTSPKLAEQTLEELQVQVQQLPRMEFANRALGNSRIIILKSLSEIMDMVNDYAPEHLIIASDYADDLAEKVINAGSVFLGHYTTESAGDYASGTNHTLPTNGYARAYNGVNLDDYVKKITFQQVSPEGLRNIGPAVMKMAEAEELKAHSNAVAIRLKP